MRTLLLGTDFMYNLNGDLVPIEINTNLGIESNIIENYDEIFDFTELNNFIKLNNFTGIIYIGGLTNLSEKIKELCKTLNMSYEYFNVYNKIIVPEIEDTPNILIIRSAYDSTAIVDEEYCKNKVNFLNLIKNSAFGSQFAYINDDNILVNTITEIIDNGNHPNFILKPIFPKYDKNIYPKLYKISSQVELNIILQNVFKNYYLTPFYYNPNKLWNNHIQVFRSFNLLFPPELKSIPIGQHTKLSTRKIDEFSTYDNITFELINERSKYITGDGGINSPKLLDDDKVEMFDGTFKTGLDLQVGDIVKTIIIPNIYGSDNKPDVNFKISYVEFLSGTTYSENKVLAKNRVDKLVEYVTITFEDNTTWEDTKNSSYLILRDDEVRFAYLNIDNPISGIKIGDRIILIDTTYPGVVTPVLKEIISVVTTKQIFGGWEITVEKEHLFLTQTIDNTSFVAIEHNTSCTVMNCITGECTGKELCFFGTCTAAACTICTSYTLYGSTDDTTYFGWDACDPGWTYTEMQLAANNPINTADICARDSSPIVTGGSGYVGSGSAQCG